MYYISYIQNLPRMQQRNTKIKELWKNSTETCRLEQIDISKDKIEMEKKLYLEN